MTLEQLRVALADADPEVRRRAVVSLEDSGVEEAGELALVALGDDDWRVRKEAVRVAGELSRNLDLLPDLVAAITQGENVGLRNAALEVLGGRGHEAAQKLLAALPRVPAHGRKFVVEALGDTGDPLVVQELAVVARGDDPNVVAAAIDALARIGGTEAELALRDQLRSRDPFQRMAALDGLERLGATVPWEDLEPLLDDRLVRRVALRVLGRTGRPEAVSPLVEALQDPSSHVLASAAVALSQLRGSVAAAAEVGRRVSSLPSEAQEGLRRLLGDGDVEQRRAVATLCLVARDASCLAGVVELAVEGALSREMLDELRAWGSDAVEPLLVVHVSRVGQVRALALELASDLAATPLQRGEQVAPSVAHRVRLAIRAAFEDHDPEVRRRAVRSMTWWAEPPDAKRLVELASTGDEDLARAAGAVLEALAVRSPDQVRRSLAPVALEGSAGAALTTVVGSLGGRDAIERLQTALSADDPPTRRAAVEALADVGGERAAEHIALALTDDSVDVQTAAARALGRVRSEDGRAVGSGHLLLALSSDSPAVRAAAARALGEAGEGRAVEPLRELVREGAPGVAVAAMEGLRALHDPTLGDLLVEALGHQDEEVVKQALRALAETGSERSAHRLSLGLSHKAWDVRRLAAALLGDVGGEEAETALAERLAQETDDLVRDALEEALRKIRWGG